MKKLVDAMAGRSKGAVEDAIKDTTDDLIELAKIAESKGNYKEAAEHYGIAADTCKSYGNKKTRKLAGQYDTKAKAMRKMAKEGKLEKKAGGYTPDYQIAIIAGASFLLSIIISSLNITGQTIGGLDKQVPIAGGLFFLIGIILLFFLSR